MWLLMFLLISAVAVFPGAAVTVICNCTAVTVDNVVAVAVAIILQFM